MALVQYLKQNDTFRQQWESELMQISVKKTKSVEEVRKASSSDRNSLREAVERTPSLNVTEASVYHEGEDGGMPNNALETRLLYSDSNEGLTSCAANWGKFPP